MNDEALLFRGEIKTKLTTKVPKPDRVRCVSLFKGLVGILA
jgi:hypothetical protein